MLLSFDWLPPQGECCQSKIISNRICRVSLFPLLHWADVNSGELWQSQKASVWRANRGNGRWEEYRNHLQISLKRRIKQLDELFFCWEAAEPDTPVRNVKCRDEWLQRKASGQCQRVYQMELQTASSSASKGYSHKSKSTLPMLAVWEWLATCHASVSSTVLHTWSIIPVSPVVWEWWWQGQDFPRHWMGKAVHTQVCRYDDAFLPTVFN